MKIILMVSCVINSLQLTPHFTFNKLALIATIIVLKLINTGPAAGLNKTPDLYRTPAANGSAMTL